MQKKKITNRFAIAGAAVLSVFGFVISFIQLVDSLKYGFDFYRFGPAFLFIVCFLLLAAYAFSHGLKSVATFRSVLASYGLVVILTGIVWPPVYPHGTKIYFIAAAVLVVLGLFSFDRSWADVKKSRIFLTFAYIVELVSAYFALTGNPMAMEGNFVAQSTLFIRPIILSTIAVCYLARMYQKKLEAQSTSAK